MKQFTMPHTEITAPNLVLGLMRIAEKSDEEIRTLVRTARDAGIDFLDHADIYGGQKHRCEERFAEALALTPSERDQVTIQTKAGIVTDGGVRDHDAVAAVGIPVYSNGAHPAVLGRKHVPWDIDVTVACGGATVQPGDVLVGDRDGVVVIPPRLVEEVVDAALAQEEEDAWIAEQIAAGHPVDGLFPMNAAWRERYAAWRQS